MRLDVSHDDAENHQMMTMMTMMMIMMTILWIIRLPTLRAFHHWWRRPHAHPCRQCCLSLSGDYAFHDGDDDAVDHDHDDHNAYHYFQHHNMMVKNGMTRYNCDLVRRKDKVSLKSLYLAS